MEDSNTNEDNTTAAIDLNENIDIDFDFDVDDVEVAEIGVEVGTAAAVGGSASASDNKKRKRMTSEVWSHYDILPVGSDGKHRCKCKKCGTQYLCDSKMGTGNLKRHLQNCKKRNIRDIGQLILQSSTSASVTITDEKFDALEFRDLMTACVIMHDLPFQCVEWVGFRAVLRYLRRDVQMFSRNTVRSDCMKLFHKEKSQLISLLSKNNGRISLTTDLWTSINTDGFICLTAHYIDNNWRLRKKIISFGFMPPPHDGLALFQKLNSFLIEWKIEKKVFTITLDNASSNNVAVDHLRNHLNLRGALLCEGKFLHLRCCAHIINLVVQAGLKEVDISIVKVRECVKYIKGSQVRKHKFLECVETMCLESKKGLRQDVPTRWNSTYTMLQNAIYFKRAFIHLALLDPNFSCAPTPLEWDKLERICAFLKPFYLITRIFSGSTYPTANLYFPCISTAYAGIKAATQIPSEFMSRMVFAMLEKFEKYWSDFNTLLAVAVILDPRYKLSFIDWCYKQLYGDDYLPHLSKVKDALCALFSSYSSRRVRSLAGNDNSPLTSTPGNPTSSRSTNPGYTVSDSDFLEGYDVFKEDDFMLRKSELDLYLDEPTIHRKTELLVIDYWKVNQFRFPELAAMARDILCIPISTVASESAFSNSGRILDQYRSALKPDVVEALVCTKDWLYGEQATIDPELEYVTEDIMNPVVSQGESTTATETGLETAARGP